MDDFEKLGVFYLGRGFDPAAAADAPHGGPLLYDSRDLTTHAVCVGMTGSGKTGLCVALLEEAAIDGIPALVIDPKGDIANLLLTFPNLSAEEFAPWVNPEDARLKGFDPDAYAAAEAVKWQKGLASWGMDAARVRRLRESADFTVYTPGSDAGLPVSILKSFEAPDETTLNDREALRERIGATVTSLLGLAGIQADPVQSREHILLSTILDQAWRKGASLDLAAIIGQVQQPPFAKVGVLDLDSFYPPKDRFGLAMALNNLLASPGFEAWLAGDPLDIQSMLYTPQGKPRVSIFSIAHLTDAERMFFVSLLLNQTLGWVRRQSGTTSLRAILYMDEIFGYFPPTAEPPSKRPLLTLLKQARAFGLGVVLATQNPVDLDYKGLANTGTWFIGRLQTERDKMRVLEGLEGAVSTAGGRFDRGAMEQTLAGLGNRVFLMNNVHDDAPTLFETRWVLSYLRGPLTRPQIRTLMEAKRASLPAAPSAAAPLPGATPAAVQAESPQAPPVLPPQIPQYFAPLSGGVLHYEPRLLGAASLHFSDPKLGVDLVRDVVFATPVNDAAVPVDWDQSEALEIPLEQLRKSPSAGASFAALPPAAANPKNYPAWQKSFALWLFQSQAIEILRSPSTGQCSKPGEPEAAFRLRLQQAARETRDDQVAKLRARYAPKLQTLNDRLMRARQRAEVEKQQAQSATVSSMLNIGTSLLGAFLGRKTISATNIGRVGSAARSVSKIGKERADIARAEETVEAVQAQIQALEQQFEQEVNTLAALTDPAAESLETIAVKPKKTGVEVKLLALVWQ